MIRAGILVLALVVAGCQAPSRYPVDSPWYQPPAGSELVLNEAVEIPPGSATLRFQFGRIVHGVNEFETNCVFELTTVRDAPQRVAPDTFRVTRVRSGSSIHRAARPAAGWLKARFVSDDAGPIRYYYQTEMFLHSERQPQVLMMTCQHAWDTGGFSNLALQRPPTVAEMRQAFGAYFTLRLPGV